MKKIIFFFLAGILTLGCTLPTFLFPTPESASPDCLNLDITEADIASTLDFGTRLLDTGDWIRTYSADTSQVYASYGSAELNAVVFVDTIAFCNTPAELKAWVTEENLDIILSNYEQHTREKSCEKDGILLYQFTAFNQGTNYNINLWFSPLVNPNRALEVMLVFPQADTESMQTYSTEFFPSLTTCK